LRYFPTSFGLDMQRETISSSAGEMPASNQTARQVRPFKFSGRATATCGGFPYFAE
jgi:hypothetical protein